MRRLFSLIIAVVLLAALSIPAFAAQTATVTVTASKTTVKPGDKVTFTVSVTQVKDAKQGGFRFVFDESVFEYVEGKRQSTLRDFMAGISTAADKIAGFFMNGKKTVEGDLFAVTLRVKTDAKPGAYTVTGKANIKAGDTVECTVKEAAVTVTDGKAAPEETTKPVEDTPTTQPDKITDVLKPEDPQTGDSNEISATTPVQTAPSYAEDMQGQTAEPAFPWWIIAAVAAVALAGGTFLIVEFKKGKSS